MGSIFDDVSKMATLGLLKTKLFQNKAYVVKIFVHDVNNKVLLRYSNYTVDVVM